MLLDPVLLVSSVRTELLSLCPAILAHGAIRLVVHLLLTVIRARLVTVALCQVLLLLMIALLVSTALQGRLHRAVALQATFAHRNANIPLLVNQDFTAHSILLIRYNALRLIIVLLFLSLLSLVHWAAYLVSMSHFVLLLQIPVLIVLLALLVLM